MKYKNYFKSIIYLALGAFTLGSCEDFLDRQEDEKLTLIKSGNPETLPSNIG